MKGFLKVFLIVILVSVVALLAIGGTCCFVSNKIKTSFNEQMKDNNPASIEQRAREIAGFSLPEGYSIVKAFDIFGVKFAGFKYEPDSQFLGLAKVPTYLFKFNETNFADSLTPEEINKAIQQSQYKTTRLKEFTIIEKGKLQTENKEMPYVYAKVIAEDTVRDQILEFEGLFAVSTVDGNNIVVLSGNPIGKFNMVAAKEFIKTLNVN